MKHRFTLVFTTAASLHYLHTSCLIPAACLVQNDLEPQLIDIQNVFI